MEISLLDQKISEAVKKYTSGDVPGIALLIGEKGKIVYRKGFGLANIEKKEYITPDNSFFIASVTKQFTTMAIMILKERGLLEYDETIERFFPDFPSYVKKVTIRHLMTHTSGIKEYFDEKFFEIAAVMEERMHQGIVLELIKGLGGDLDFEPGTKFTYCNSSYVMLGAIVEKLSGMTFAEFLEENIFKPLGMKNSVVGYSLDQRFDNLATGYKLKENSEIEKAPYDMATIGWADGNIITKVDDLFIWHNALYTEKLVKKETLEEAFTSYVLKDGTPTGYGFGWFINKRRGLKEIEHGGLTIGYCSLFTRFVEEDVVIIMLANLMGMKISEVFGAVAEIYLDKRLSPINYIDVSLEELKTKIGKFKAVDEKEKYTCEIVLDESSQKLKVYYDFEGFKGENIMNPMEEFLFRLDTPADYYITFEKSDSAITGLQFNLGGGNPIKFKRV